MKNAVVVYSSKYGSTKKYAEWIASDLSCELFEKKDITAKKLKQYDTIIYGGGLYAGGVNGIQLITKAFDQIKDKNLVVYTCGLADLQDPNNVQSIRKSLNKVFTQEMQDNIQVFHLRGAIDYSKLSTVHKIMMGTLHKMLLKKDAAARTNEDNQFLETYGKSVDFTDKQSLSPLLYHVKSLY